MTSNDYLIQTLNKYQAKNLYSYSSKISTLKNILQTWASSCFVEILDSGSRAKETAIHLASDVDYLVSLTSGCNENNILSDLLSTNEKNNIINKAKESVSKSDWSYIVS